MKRLQFIFFLLISFSGLAQDLWVKNNPIIPFKSLDSSVFYINPNSTSFFDDKEFISNIKKGYTLPGFIIQPQVVYKPSPKTTIFAGFHSLYYAGTDSLEKFLPVLSLEFDFTEDMHIVLGTLHTEQLHFLPEPLFKPERLFTSTPETGFQVLTTTEKLKIDNWNNWERFIKTGSKFQEVFTVGLTAIYKPSSFKVNTGFTFQFYGLAFHNGGQIDSTNLKVTTMFNFGGAISYNLPIGNTKGSYGLEIAGFLSTDKSPNPVSKYKKGNALYPKLYLEWPEFRAEVGYWQAETFVNPRGEELFGSYSTIKPQFDEKTRNLITGRLIYSKLITKGFSVGARFDTYYDYKASIIDWAVTLKMVFNRDILIPN